MKSTNLSAALREATSEANVLAFTERRFNIAVMSKEFGYLSTLDQQQHDSETPSIVRGLARSHKVQRGLRGRDSQIQTAFYLANKDNRRIEQRDQYRAYREAKKLAARIG